MAAFIHPIRLDNAFLCVGKDRDNSFLDSFKSGLANGLIKIDLR